MHDFLKLCRICFGFFSQPLQTHEVKHKGYTYTLKAQARIYGSICIAFWSLAEYALESSARPSKPVKLSIRVIPILWRPDRNPWQHVHDPLKPCRICFGIFSHAFQTHEVKHRCYTYTLKAQARIYGSICMALGGLAEYALESLARHPNFWS